MTKAFTIVRRRGQPFTIGVAETFQKSSKILFLFIHNTFKTEDLTFLIHFCRFTSTVLCFIIIIEHTSFSYKLLSQEQKVTGTTENVIKTS